MGRFLHRRPDSFVFRAFFVILFVLVLNAGAVLAIDSDENPDLTIQMAQYGCGKPQLGLSVGSIFWASMNDYLYQTLSIQYVVLNGGSDPAYDVNISHAGAGNGVTVASGLPADLGDIAGGNSGGATVRYQLPPGGGVQAFYTRLNGTSQDECGGSYTYP